MSGIFEVRGPNTAVLLLGPDHVSALDFEELAASLLADARARGGSGRNLDQLAATVVRALAAHGFAVPAPVRFDVQMPDRERRAWRLRTSARALIAHLRAHVTDRDALPQELHAFAATLGWDDPCRGEIAALVDVAVRWDARFLNTVSRYAMVAAEPLLPLIGAIRTLVRDPDADVGAVLRALDDETRATGSS